MELVKINNKSGIQTVNARELHGFLESKQEFASWIKGRITKYEFVDGQDFTVDKFINGRSTCIDYHISIDMAKELSMVENNDKGRQARSYFIGCEKKLQKLPQMSQLQILHAVTGEMCKLSSRLDSVELTQSLMQNKVNMLTSVLKTIEHKPTKTKEPSIITLNPGIDSVKSFVENLGLVITKAQARAIGRSAAAICRNKEIEVTYKKARISNKSKTSLYPKVVLREALKRCSNISI